MIAASWARDDPLDDRLLVVDPAGDAWRHSRVRDLPGCLRPRDVLVVNDAATLPASLAASTIRGIPVEIRLAGRVPGPPASSHSRGASAIDGSGVDARWRAVLFGPGDWRTRTEDRPPPPRVDPGEVLYVGSGLSATIEDVDVPTARLVTLRFSLHGAALWAALYRHGRPIQYAHVRAPIELWHAQTPFATRPWAVEMPSAARPLTWGLVGRLRARGVRVHRLTHAAGLSSTGDPELDARLPLPETYDIPDETVAAVRSARDLGDRVVAVGTTVVRALEGAAANHAGRLVPGAGTTALRIEARTQLQVVGGIVSGLHETGTSHRSLLQAFAPETLLARAWYDADSRGYLAHEFGDSCLVLAV